MKKEYLIIIFLLLGPILDVTSFLGLPFSIFIRGIFLLGIISYLIIKKQDLKILIPLLLISIIIFVYQLLYLKFGFIDVCSTILKFLYLPVCILYFKNYHFPIEKSKVLGIVLITYIGIYLLSYVFGIGADAYLETDGKSGFKGLFSSINEFSAIIVCLLPIVSNYLNKNKKFILMTLLIILALLCSLLIGTKVMMGGIIFTILYLLFQHKDTLFFKRTKKGKIGIIGLLFLILVIGCVLFTKTRTYQNMMVQQDFFQVENVFSFDFVNRIVFNDRLTFLENNISYFKKQDIGKQLLGIGINKYDIKMVEIDIFDVLFRYGIISFIVFISSIFISTPWKRLKQEEKISIFLLIVISLTSGHVLISPAVCIYFSVMTAETKIIKNDKIEKSR